MAPAALPVRLLQRRFEVEAPLQEAWSHLERVVEWPSWAQHIRSVELAPPGRLTLASRGVITLKNGIRSTFSMTQLDAGRNWKWAGPFLWLTVEYDHRFRSTDAGGTEVEFVVEGKGFGVGVIGRLFARIYARNLDRAIPRLIAELRLHQD